MASLRARLLAGVLALTAVGLLLLGSITYAEQRSFLYKRVDQQAQTAPSAVAHDLQEGGGGSDDYGPRGPRGGCPRSGARRIWPTRSAHCCSSCCRLSG